MNQFQAFRAVTQVFHLCVCWTCRFMYWTDWGLDERIEKANMDGTNRTIVIHSGLYFPSGLALDIAKNWLYWVDSYNDKLEVYEFSSNTRREIISANQEAYLSDPFRLALHENHLFWTNWRWRYYGVYRVDRNTGLNAQKILSSLSRPMSIRAYDKEIDLISGIFSLGLVIYWYFKTW